MPQNCYFSLGIGQILKEALVKLKELYDFFGQGFANSNLLSLRENVQQIVV